MNRRSVTVICLPASLVLSGCVSATPRPYSPVVQPPPVDQGAFGREFSACGSEVAAGRRNFGQSPSAAVVGAVGTVAAVQVLSGVGATAAVGGGATLAATGVGLIVLVPIATYRLSSARRRRNETAIQEAMTACLAERGYTVTSWVRMSRQDALASAIVTPTHALTDDAAPN